MLRFVLAAFVTVSGVAQAEESLVGAWQTPFQELEDNVFYQLTREFKADGTFTQKLQVELHHPLFPTPLVTVIEELNSYEIGEATGTEGATELDETLIKTFETLKTQAWVDQHNQEGYCGYTNWQLGVRKETTGRDCNGVVHRVGDKHYNLFKITGTTINFAIKPWHDAAIGSTPESRPPVLGPSIGYKRM